MPFRPGRRRDAGMVTAETAVLLPVLVVVLAAAAVFVLACVAAQLQCVDAARAAARVAARGEPAVTVTRTVVRPGGGPGDGATVEVVVRAQVQPFGGALRGEPGVRVSARAVAAVEQAAP